MNDTAQARISVYLLGRPAEQQYRLCFHGRQDGEPAALVPVDANTAKLIATIHAIDIVAYPRDAVSR